MSMLKKFFLNSLSSFVGAWIAIVLFGVVAVLVVISLIGKFGVSQMSTSGNLTKHSVLTLELNGVIEEREMPADVDYMTIINGDFGSVQTLTTLINAIREAKTNKDIDMIYIKCGGLSAGVATLHALREELKDFKSSGKKIYAYADGMSNGDYYVATVADSLFLNPEGSLALTGLTGTSLYMKNLFDKIGIKFQVAKVGTYKSAVEPFISNEMSAPARAQLDTLFVNIWNVLLDEMASSRKIKATELNRLVSDEYLTFKKADFLVSNKLIDKAVYERSMDERIAKAINIDKEKLNFVAPELLSTVKLEDVMSETSDRVAVLYATGEIREGTKNGINCEVLVPVITSLADDDKVKGMVLRVNSPGGSVFGSEQIAEALAYFQKKGKPLAVSMGDYAASGGYWISCHANKIFADATTITGSIGIYGLFPNAKELAQKIGITPQTVSTNPNANFPTFFEEITPEQQGVLQKYIEKGYEDFINRVSTGRKMKPARVREIAEGRVWDGQKALKLGLVDELGDLDSAIKWVKGQCKEGEKLKISNYPQMEPGFWDMVRISMQSETHIALIKEAMKMCPEAVEAVEVGNVLRRKNEQALMQNLQLRLN